MINMTNRLHKNIKPIGQKFGFRFLETFRRILSITWSPGRDLVSPISVFLIITPTNSLYCNQTAPYASKGCMRNEKSDDFSQILHRFYQAEEIDHVYTNPTAAIKPGARCRECKTGTLGFDGTLNLICNECNTIVSTSGACT